MFDTYNLIQPMYCDVPWNTNTKKRNMKESELANKCKNNV